MIELDAGRAALKFQGNHMVTMRGLPAATSAIVNRVRAEERIRMSCTMVAGARSDRVQRTLIVVALNLDENRLVVRRAA